jgi:hypothetical protein
MKPYRFAADSMVGGLAKWLRLLGLDTIYLRSGPRPPQIARILLTRRSNHPPQRLPAGWPEVLLLSSNQTLDQVQEVIRRFGLTRADLAPLTRCSLCNLELEKQDARQVADRVPDYVRLTQTVFVDCPGCGRVYWPGTHQQRMERMIEAFFDEAGGGCLDGSRPEV